MSRRGAHGAHGAHAATRVVATASGPPASRVVLWFRSDLRLHDNYCVAEAAALAKAGADVVPVYCLDPRHWGKTAHGHKKTGAHRALFLLESLADLRASLRAKGSDLLVVRAQPEDVLPRLAAGKSVGPTVVVSQTEVATEEAAVDTALEAALKPVNGTMTRLWGRTLLHLDDLPFDATTRDMPTVFTPFRTLVEGKTQPRQPVPTASLPANALPLPKDMAALGQEAAADALLAHEETLASLGFTPAEIQAAVSPDPRGVMRFRGGETAALARLKHYLWDTDALAKYFDTRNGMLGADYSTKFSPWLAHGCLSPRLVAAECARYERERTKNKSTYWVVFELLWRDFYHFLFLRHGAAMFRVSGFRNQAWQWSTDAQLFTAWKQGCTGHPLVDANMRELAATGFMSNRGRQNVASFLTQNLGIDWRLGAEYFEEQLNDYDVHSNWGNWLFAAGITGGRVNVFNIVKQSNDYDPQGDYIKTWLPELQAVPLQYLFQPGRMPAEVQNAAKCVIGRDYPSPVPDKLRGPASSFRDGAPPPPGGGAAPPRNGFRGGRGGHGKEERRTNNRGSRSEFERYG